MHRQPGDGTRKSSTAPAAGATHAGNSSRFTVGATIRGEIVSQEPNGTYTVACVVPRKTVSGVELASPIFGGLMGFNVRCMLLPGTRVMLAYGNPSFIYAIVPKKNEDWRNAGNRTMVWGPKVNTKAAATDTPEDLLEGEAELSNLFGVSMSFLTTLIKMKAGDRAMVECHLINDMVRIISSQYRHFSGMGEDLIFDHGRPTMERSWSSYRHELMNQLKQGTPVAPLSGDGVKESDMSAERVSAVGRHRFLEYIGFAGDFIHSFVTDPPETMVKMTLEHADTCKRSGKSWEHRGADGSYLIQSVADIRLERVVRIPVPVRVASHEDEAVTKARQYDKLNEAYLKLFEFGKMDDKSAYRQAYQLRVYSRWLSRFHAFARMLQMPGEYKMWSESDTPKPSWTNAEDDKTRANPRVEYYDAYACICILRDGSITMHDHYGSSVVMSNGNLQLSAARHLDLEASGDIRMIAGGSILTKARRNIEFNATDGGIIFSSYAWFKVMCEKGSVWLRSMAKTADIGDAPAALEGRNGGPVPEVLEHGVLVESTAGGIAFRADRQIQVKIDGAGSGGDAEDDGISDLNYAFVVDASNVRMRTKGHFILGADKSVIVTAAKTMAVNTPALYGSMREFDLGKNFRFSNGKLTVALLQSKMVQSNSLQGLKIGPMPDPDAPTTRAVPRHLNHIGILKDADRIELTEGDNDAAKKALEFAKGQDIRKTPSQWTRSSEGALWSFPPPEEYSWDSREETKGAFVESLTQQYLRSDVTDDIWGGAGYETWTWASNTGATGIRMGDYKAGFGSGAVVYRSKSGENLHAPSNADPVSLGNVSLSWNIEPFSMKTLKRDE